jgi:hypothetical protein
VTYIRSNARYKRSPERKSINAGSEPIGKPTSIRQPRVQREPAAQSIVRPHEFESLARAEELNHERIAGLNKRARAIARALATCSEENRCRRPICAVCSRDFRMTVTEQIIGIVTADRTPRETITIFLGEYEAGSLQDVSIAHAHDRLRKSLSRSSFTGSTLVGGTEVAWSAQRDRWILHVHLLALGVPLDAWDQLRVKLPSNLPSAPLVVQSLNDLPSQISFLTKFATYHRPRERTGQRPSRAFPLPDDRLVELANWWSQYRFRDFAFLFGARRRGQRIVPDGQ